MTSSNHRAMEGGVGDFHPKRIRRRASSEVKAMTSDWAFVTVSGSRGTPKIAVKGLGSIGMFNASDKVLNTPDQYESREGQDQKLCVRLAGENEHLLQLASDPGYISASLALL